MRVVQAVFLEGAALDAVHQVFRVDGPQIINAGHVERVHSTFPPAPRCAGCRRAPGCPRRDETVRPRWPGRWIHAKGQRWFRPAPARPGSSRRQIPGPVRCRSGGCGKRRRRRSEKNAEWRRGFCPGCPCRNRARRTKECCGTSRALGFELDLHDFGKRHHDFLFAAAAGGVHVHFVGGDAGDALDTFRLERPVFTVSTRFLSASRRMTAKNPENFVSKNRRLNVNCPR